MGLFHRFSTRTPSPRHPDSNFRFLAEQADELCALAGNDHGISRLP
jgi:hypothetical protein